MGKHGKVKEKNIKTKKKEEKQDIVLQDEEMPKDTKVRKAKAPRQNKGTKRRKTLSYENVPIDEYTEKEVVVDKKIIKKTVVVFGILIFLVLVVAFFVNRDSITFDNFSSWISNSVFGTSEGEGFPVEIRGTNVSKGNFKLVNGLPCYASDTSYVELSDTAGDAVNSQLSYDNPVVKGTNNFSIIYGVGSKGYMICNSLEEKKKANTDEGVFSADINDKGYYVIVTEGNGYLSELAAYNSEYKKIYSYKFSDFYITSVSINSSGTGAVCCGLSTENGDEKTRIYVLDFSSEKPEKTYDIVNSIAYESFSLSSEKAIVVASDGVYSFDFDEDDPKKFDYETSILTTYSYNPDTKMLSVVLSRSGDRRNCDVVVFDSNGNKDEQISTELQIDSVSTYKGTIGILSNGQAYILDEDGSLSDGVDVGNDAQSILLSSRDDAYILGISEIREAEID